MEAGVACAEVQRPGVEGGGHRSWGCITLRLEDPGKEFGFYFKCEEFLGGFSVGE